MNAELFTDRLRWLMLQTRKTYTLIFACFKTMNALLHSLLSYWRDAKVGSVLKSIQCGARSAIYQTSLEAETFSCLYSKSQIPISFYWRQQKDFPYIAADASEKTKGLSRKHCLQIWFSIFCSQRSSRGKIWKVLLESILNYFPMWHLRPVSSPTRRVIFRPANVLKRKIFSAWQFFYSSVVAARSSI